MITKLRISNFRCFKSLRLEGLRRLNLIIGLNASGKTALLEALAYAATTAAEAGNGDGWERARLENGLDADAMTRSGQALLRAARRHNTQVFATTNNHDYIRNMGAMLADYGEDIRLIRTTIQHDAGARTHTGCVLAGEAVEAALDDNLKIR